jgi:hypothetical protein
MFRISLYTVIMMTKLSQAVEAISSAEERLRSLIGEAAKRGDYSAVRRLSTAAERLAVVREELDESAESKTPAAIKTFAKRKRKRVQKASGSRASPPGYPRFERRGDIVFRIGWSKKSKGEYEHKLPNDVYTTAIEKIAEVAAERRGPFAAKEILERADQSGNTLPSYLVYVTLALLCESGVLTRHGRDGYTVVASNLAGAAEIAWAQVGER